MLLPKDSYIKSIQIISGLKKKNPCWDIQQLNEFIQNY